MTLFSKAKGSGPNDGLLGFSGSTVTVRFGSIIYTYDEKSMTLYPRRPDRSCDPGRSARLGADAPTVQPSRSAASWRGCRWGSRRSGLGQRGDPQSVNWKVLAGIFRGNVVGEGSDCCAFRSIVNTDSV